MSRPRIGKKRMEMILHEYFNSDLLVSEIARNYGVSRTAVNWYAKNYGKQKYPALHRIKKPVSARVLTGKGFLVASSLLYNAGFKRGDMLRTIVEQGCVKIVKK